jgi:hypothetical protein
MAMATSLSMVSLACLCSGGRSKTWKSFVVVDGEH